MLKVYIVLLFSYVFNLIFFLIKHHDSSWSRLVWFLENLLKVFVVVVFLNAYGEI